ncbi:GPI-anchored CFEM domain protein [Beauveria bassiana]|nr:GPI-anchored CFEM domain protein [Beauveria bassiana]
MKSSLSASYASHLTSLTIALYLAGTVQASNKCAPATWLAGQFKARGIDTDTSSLPSSASPSGVGTASSRSSSMDMSVSMSPLLSGGDITAGEVNCRYSASTKGMDINYYSCMALATKYGISIEKFFQLNPALHPDCGNIQGDTDYCVDGFIEPVRATNGLCGPANGNATCLGTEFQCCNARTWRCGNSQADCADGTCYEGACAGDAVFTTNGECGRQHGYKQCVGIWGDCCNAEGKCGTGESFCGYGKCQLGNCRVVLQPPKVGGLTPDGTCGGKYQYKCNIAYGECCNKYGMCGSQPPDCGIGCQPLFGNCASPAASTTSNQPSSVPATTTTSANLPSTYIPTETDLPSCGQLCFKNMLAQHSALGCDAQNAYCMCNNVDFSNGLRDCSNGACGQEVASTVIAFGKSYCSAAFASHTAPATATGISSLPYCGQTCFNNMRGQYSQLGCGSPDPYCLCSNTNFSNGIRDCSNAACGTDVARTVIAFGREYCSAASASHSAQATAQPTVAFQVQPHLSTDCDGDSDIALVDFQSGSNGRCINLACHAASLGIHAAGDCPDGHVQLSYWQESDCSGEWYGYGYASRNTCRVLWSGGLMFKSLWMKCMAPSDDCVTKGTCVPNAEPKVGICEKPAVAFRLQSRYHTDCTGEVHDNSVVNSGSNGMCVETDCMVGSLDIAGVGDCPDDNVQLSYWGEKGCTGEWYGYGYGSRGTCRHLWSDGNKFRSLWVKCAKESDDCVYKGTCVANTEPVNSKC